MSGELKKMMIVGYTDDTYAAKAGSYTAQINPETYVYTYQIAYNKTRTPGTSASALRFNRIEPHELQFDFLFDGTGVIPKPLTGIAGALSGIPIAGAVASALSGGNKPVDVVLEIENFRKVAIDYSGDIHRPRHVKLYWGTLLFKGCLTSLSITYKLFKPDGTPLRAVAKAQFLGHVDDTIRVAIQNDQSPDLTHVRTVKEGDTLPLMTYQIYGDSVYYLEVARVNNLTNFRSLTPGDKIYFPPIQK